MRRLSRFKENVSRSKLLPAVYRAIFAGISQRAASPLSRIYHRVRRHRVGASLRKSSRKEFRVLNERRRLRRLGDHHPPTKEQGDYEYILGAITRAMRRDTTLYVATTPTPTPTPTPSPTPTMTTKTMTMSRTRVCCTRDKGPPLPKDNYPSFGCYPARSRYQSVGG